jgi:hypothetical protein
LALTEAVPDGWIPEKLVESRKKWNAEDPFLEECFDLPAGEWPFESNGQCVRGIFSAGWFEPS